MAYDDVKQVFGREPVYTLELELDICSNVYRDGVSPGVGFCTADLPAGQECFQTFPNCQDQDNFDKANLDINPTGPVTKKVYRFSNKRVDELQGAGEAFTFPTLRTVSMQPTKLNPSKGLGDRASVRISLQDHPWTDQGIDPYVNTRTNDPDKQGTFWGKFINRNRFYEGRIMRIRTGYLEPDGTFDIANFITRHYIITRIAGPDYKGNVIVEGKDIIKLADNDRAQWPPPPKAFLTADINSSITTFNYEDNNVGLVAWCDIGGLNEQPYLRIDDEIMRVSAITATQITATRATMPSFYSAPTNTAEDHTSNSGIQQCYLYDNLPIADVYFQLLNTAANIGSFFLPLTDWEDIITESGYQGYIMNRLLVESEGVKEYLGQLVQHNVYIWWDEREQEIKMGTLLPGELGAVVFNEDEHIIDGSIARTFDVKNRINEFWIGYAHRNPILDPTKDFNLSEWIIPVNQTSQSIVQNNDRKIRRIRSMWLAQAQQAVASEISNRTLIDGIDSKKIITLTLDPKDDNQWTGDFVSVNTRLIQDAAGANETTNFLILEVNENLAVQGPSYEYLLREATVFDRVGVIAPDCDPEGGILVDEGLIVLDDGEEICDDEFPNYLDASDALKSRYIFIAYDNAPDPPADPTSPAGFNDGTPAYQIQ